MRKRRLMLIGSVCLSLVLAALLLPACAPAAPEEVAEEIAALEAEIDDLEGDVAAEKAKTKKLQDEIAELRKPAEVIKWRCSTQVSRGSDYFAFQIENFKKPIEEMAGGRMEIEVFAGGELHPQLEAFPALREGLVELCFDYSGFHEGELPTEGIECGLPGSWRTPNDVLIFDLDLGFMDWKQEKIFDDAGLKWVMPIPESSQELWSNRPITSIEDIKGMKIRSLGILNDMWKSLGAKLTEVAFDELYVAGMTGVLDATTCGSISEAYGEKLYEPFPYILFPSAQELQVSRFITGLDTWNKLPEDLQAIVQEGLRNYASRLPNYLRLDNMTKLGDVVDVQGGTVCWLTGDDLAKFTAVKMESWDIAAAKSALDAETVERFRSFVKLLGYAD